MADRLDFYFRQAVQESELDLGFELLEKADRDLAADLGIHGIVSGAEPTQHSPVPNLTIDLTPPCRAYDHLGQRIFFGTGQTVDCTVDHTGIPTDVSTAGHERWLGVFLKFDRLLSDPRTDGNSQQVFFRRDESFQIIVRQGAQAPAGSAPKVALVEDELLVCDIRRTPGQTQIYQVDIDTSRRQSFLFAQAQALEVMSNGWKALQPAANTVQSALDSADELLDGHFRAVSSRHAAEDVDYTPHGFVAAGSVQGAIDEIVDDISSVAVGSSGASTVGAEGVPGTPHALSPGNVNTQLTQLLSRLNDHVSALQNSHAASSISAGPHAHITTRNVQEQLQEIVDSLASQGSTPGASRIGDGEIPGNPHSLTPATVRQQLNQLLSHLNSHTRSDDHDDRYYNLGEKVADADTLDGIHAAGFSPVGHDHHGVYLRVKHFYYGPVNANSDLKLGTVPERPASISLFCIPFDTSGDPKPITLYYGSLLNNFTVYLKETPSGNFEVHVSNGSSEDTYITLLLFGSD